MQESRRVELQLRGRAGRQGDPGTTLMMYDSQDPYIAVQNSMGEQFTGAGVGATRRTPTSPCRTPWVSLARAGVGSGRQHPYIAVQNSMGEL